MYHVTPAAYMLPMQLFVDGQSGFSGRAERKHSEVTTRSSERKGE